MSSDTREPTPHRSGFVGILGPANAGKSTLLNTIVGEKISIVSPKEQTTRNRVLGIKDTDDAQLIFLDTPGFLSRRYKGELYRYISKQIAEAAAEVDVNLLVVDAVQALKEPNLAPRLRASFTTRSLKRPQIIALNKVDLVRKPDLLPLLAALDAAFSEHDGGAPVGIVPVSALKGDGTERLVEVLSGLLPEGPELFPKGTLTDQPERFLAAELIREKLFYQLNKELPYSIAVQIERWEEDEEMLRIYAVILVERTSQRKIVIGSGGSKLKSIGTSARVELEKLFGSRVYLELFVRVAPDWTKSRRGLEEAGYRR